MVYSNKVVWSYRSIRALGNTVSDILAQVSIVLHKILCTSPFCREYLSNGTTINQTHNLYGQ
jgi:hypothetical protein